MSSSVPQLSVLVGSLFVWQRLWGGVGWALSVVKRGRRRRRIVGAGMEEGVGIFGWIGGDAGEGVDGW